MPGGISLLLSLPADIPTPDVGRATIFINSATGEPSYKDSAGATHTLVGLAGSAGAAGGVGPTGPASPLFIGADGLDGQDGISVPGSGSVSGGAAGALVLLEQHTASASATLDFTTGLSSVYDDYLIEMINLVPASANPDFYFRVSTDGGSSFAATNYYSTSVITGLAIGVSAVAQNPGNQNLLGQTIDNTGSSGGLSGQLHLWNPRSASIRKTFTHHIMYPRSAELINFSGGCIWNDTTAVNAFRFLFSSGNIASGIIRLYGIAKT